MSEETKKRILTSEEKNRIFNRCHKRVERYCQRRGIPFDKEKYLECVENETKLFLFGKKPRHRRKREMSEEEIQRLRERMAEEKEEMDEEAFDAEIISTLKRIHELEHPEIEEAREEQRKRDKTWIEKKLRRESGYED